MLIAGHDDMTKQPTSSRKLLSTAKAMKGSKEIAAKPRNIQEINAKCACTINGGIQGEAFKSKMNGSKEFFFLSHMILLH